MPEWRYVSTAEQCILEWDGPSSSKPPVPLLKDMFSSERRKAKILNFSIAYGKTAHGLSKDWKVDLLEAQNTVDRWYADRPEVHNFLHLHSFEVLNMSATRMQSPGAMKRDRLKGDVADEA